MAVPSLVTRRKTVAPTAITRPNANAITCVQSTRAVLTVNAVESSDEKVIERVMLLLRHSHVHHARAEASARPSVATDLTSGSRAARAGPKTMP